MIIYYEDDTGSGNAVRICGWMSLMVRLPIFKVPWHVELFQLLRSTCTA